jgi:hypothetical protein
MSTIQYISIGLAVFALLFFISSIRSAKRREYGQVATNLALCFCLASMGGVFGLGSLSLRGYEAFNYEQLAATITVTPQTEGQFNALMKFPDGTTKNYLLSGDQLVIDAYILKWTPLFNILGMHTHYELARVAGRYFNVDDEQTKPHTVHPLSEESMLDMFHLSRKFGFLKGFVDAEYGSASFVPAKEAQTYILMVSTSGLLFRKIAD